MATKRGKIVRVIRDRTTGASKGFGFLRADDGTEVFVHQKLYPAGMEMLEGDELDCEISDQGGGKFQADSVAVINRGTPSAAPAARPAPASSPPQEIEVGWSFGTPIKKDRAHIILPLTLTLTSGKQPRPGIEVKLKADGTQVTEPLSDPSSDGQGKAPFLVMIASNSPVCALVATVKVGGKEKSYAHVWEKREKADAAKTAPNGNADKKLPDIEVVNPPRDPDPATGLFLVTVITRKAGANANRKLTVISTPETVEILQDTAAGLVPVTDYTPYSTGIYRLFVRFTGTMVKLVLRLDDMKETVVYLRK